MALMLKVRLDRPITVRLRCRYCGHEFARKLTHMRVGLCHRFLTRCPVCRAFIHLDDRDGPMRSPTGDADVLEVR